MGQRRIIRECGVPAECPQNDKHGLTRASAEPGFSAAVKKRGFCPLRFCWAPGGAHTEGPFDKICYQTPVFCMDFHGSAGSNRAPFCNNSIEMLSGERTKAIQPSRGGRLMVTPWSTRRWQVA
jgi:hypothetical protein